jgi:predicted RNA-binding Zn-ribbon protein involved in translation (DUF1610 family)
MDIVDRLYHQLARAVERAGPGAPDAMPTIGDIYQHLIPYRGIRGELGIWELAEYEHGLLRLLAGERGHLTVEAPEVREELARELASPNPILGIYRDYAAVPVRIAPARPAPSPQEPPPPTAPPAPPAPEPPPPVEPAPEPRLAAPSCNACGSALPDAPGLRFCPKCGQDQLEVRCQACAARLEPEWNFCIRCGRPRDGAAAGDRAGH